MFSDARLFSIFCLLSMCTAHFSDAANVIWYPNVLENVTRSRRQANCGSSSFTCKSGQCIPEDNECDGNENCGDGSDETVDNCLNIPCTSRLFKCAYGACISKSLECDGKKDCKDNSDETSSKCDKTKPAITLTTTGCSTGKFRCKSGQCINEEQACDGKADCNDSSDETPQECSGLRCPPFTHRCSYGACVARGAKCNGVEECIDGSDEANCPNRQPVTPSITPSPPTPSPPTPSPPTQPPTPGSCVIPPHPTNGEFAIGNTQTKFQPGQYVPPYSALITNCKPKHKPSPPQGGTFPVCLNGNWTPSPPKLCTRFCKSLKSSITTKITCTYRGLPLDSCDTPIEGTIAKLSCEPLYEEPSLLQKPSRLCKDGSWDYAINECFPVCGVKRPLGVVNVVGGVEATLGDYPWQIGIYNPKKSLICGGSMLDQRVVLTAAHCFTPGDQQVSTENYVIAAGKYYSNFEDDRDEYAQYSEIDELHIPPRYKGSVTFYEADLAVLILKTKFNVSKAVQPVCVDWGNNFEYQQLQENKVGIITGWGFTEVDGKPSEKLKELNVPYISYDKCYDTVPKTFRKYLTFDKVCAGYYDNGTAVCSGDSGGALTFPHFNDRYYVRGIVSTSPARGGNCDSNQYGTYTLVSKYIDFVNDLVTRYRS